MSQQNNHDYQPVILVTGCGSGLGLAIADLLYTIPRYRVMVTGRNGSIEFLKHRYQLTERFQVHELDVNIASDREMLLLHIEKIWHGVDILVNNAGICFRAVAEHMSEEDEMLQMNTNYLGPMSLIRRVLPYMRERGRGKIINISSVSGMLAMPTMSAYSASKHALDGASESLWYEVKPLGINVCLVQPGFIQSKSFERVRYSEASRAAEDSEEVYSDYYKSMTPFISRLMKFSRSSPQDIAKKVLKVIQTENPQLWIPATIDALFFYYLRRWVPRRLFLPLLFRSLPNSKHWAETYTHRRGFKRKSG